MKEHFIALLICLAALFELLAVAFLLYAAALLFASSALLIDATQLNELTLFALNACLFEAANSFLAA